MNYCEIDKVECYNTGGNCLVDLVFLKDGTVLGISDECVVLYKNEECFWEDIGGVFGVIDRPEIENSNEEN